MSVFSVSSRGFFIPASVWRRLSSIAAAVLLLLQAVHSQQPFQVRFEGIPAAHSLFWPTKPNFRYFFQMSPNLNSWQNTGEYVVGDGAEKSLGFDRTEDRFFYRIHEVGFLILPTPDQRVDLLMEFVLGSIWRCFLNFQPNCGFILGHGIQQRHGPNVASSRTPPLCAASKPCVAASFGFLIPWANMKSK